MVDKRGVHGPRTLTRVRQVSIPVVLLRALKIDAGDDVYFELTQDGKAILMKPGESYTSLKTRVVEND